MKAICFKCHYIGIGGEQARCPACTYPLIMSSDALGLGAAELERAFRRSDDRAPAAPLPGVVFRVPKPFLNNGRPRSAKPSGEDAPAARRSRRPTTRRPVAAVSAGGGTSVAALAPPGHRIAREVLAASAAFIVGLIITLGAFSAF